MSNPGAAIPRLGDPRLVTGGAQWAIGRAGFEHPAKTPEKMHISPKCGAKCGALSGDSDPIPAPATPSNPDLAALIDAWPTLPAAVKAGILAMVKSVGE